MRKTGVLAIVQARMGSSRLPGKVMKEVAGMPLIGHMLGRLRHTRHINKIVLATSTSQTDDILAEYGRSLGYAVSRGPEDNVLERFYLAAAPYDPEAVVRLTGDCALIDAEIVDRVINVYRQSGADYAWADSSFAEGLDVEVFSFTALKTMHEKATLKSELEHVTQYIHRHPERFKRVPVTNATDDSAIRIVVDEPEDLDVVTQIFDHFQKVAPGRYFGFGEVKAYLAEYSELTRKNAHVIRNEGLLKSLAKDEKVR